MSDQPLSDDPRVLRWNRDNGYYVKYKPPMVPKEGGQSEGDKPRTVSTF